MRIQAPWQSDTCPRPGAAWVNALFLSELIAISDLAIVEPASELARRIRGAISPEMRDEIYQEFLDDMERIVVVELGHQVIQEALRHTSRCAIFHKTFALSMLSI